MAVLLVERDALFLHIPKTGGTWVSNALKRSKIKLGSPNKAHKHSTLGPRTRRSKVVCFVRHPLSWLESLYRYMMSRNWEHRGWTPFLHIQDCQSNDFNTFVANIVERQPAFVTRMYEWYVGPVGQEICNFVGRRENLEDDLITILKLIGYKNFDEAAIRSVPHANVSTYPRPTWDESLKQEVLKLEKPTLDRWYSGNYSVENI